MRVPPLAAASSFADLLPMALWSAFYPTLLAMVVLLLARPRPRRLLIAYYLGGLTMSFAAAAVLIAAFDAGHSLGASNHTVGPGVDIAVGLLSLVLFWVLLTDRDRASLSPSPDAVAARSTPEADVGAIAMPVAAAG